MQVCVQAANHPDQLLVSLGLLSPERYSPLGCKRTECFLEGARSDLVACLFGWQF